MFLEVYPQVLGVSTLKRCAKCGEFKPRDQFSKQNRVKDGLQAQCKACNAIYRAEHHEKIREYKRQYHIEHGDLIRERAHRWYIDNHEIGLETRRRWHADNRDANRERSRLWHINHRDTALKHRRQYYAEHREEVLQQNRQWRKENPIAGRAAFHRRKARQRSLPDTLTITDISFAFEAFNHCCAVCERQLNGLFHRDHLDHWIPLRSSVCPGTVPHNMVPLCSDCNLSKGGKQPDEWLAEKFGKRKGRAILKRIEAYLASRKL